MANRYRTIKELGKGASGAVYRAENNETGVHFAIKMISSTNSSDGVDMTSIREIKYLKRLAHPNIINLADIYSETNTIYLVLELCPYSLTDLIFDNNTILLPSVVKCLMKQLLTGIDYLHSRYVLHRDIKPGNLLMSTDGILKISDFGLAKEYAGPSDIMSSNVMTSMYRPPEILFGARFYSTSADMWSVGCIFAELMLRYFFLYATPLNDNIAQLNVIFNTFGTPEATWPDVECLPHYVQFPHRDPLDLSDLFTGHDIDRAKRQRTDNGTIVPLSPHVDLLTKIMTLNPNTRLSAAEALNHHYFVEAPVACEPSEIPVPKFRIKN